MSEPPPPCKPAPESRHSSALLLLDPATPSGAALRATIAAVIAMALALAMHVEVPALAVVFALARGSAGVVTMVLGSVVGSALAIALLALFDQSRIAFSLSLLCLTTLGTYVALGRELPYAGVQALLSGLILVGQGLDTPHGVVRHAFYDLANVVIAAFAAFVAGASQPVAVLAQLQDTLATTVRSAAALLEATTSNAASAATLRLELLARKVSALLALSWPTRLVSRARRDALHEAVAAVDDVVRHVLALDATVRAASQPNDATTRAGLVALEESLDSVAPLLASRNDAPEDPHALRTETRDLARELRRATPIALAAPSMVAAREIATRRALAQLALLTPFLHAGRAAGPLPVQPSPARARPPFDRFRFRHAVKSGASYLIILWAWVAADWGAIVPGLVVAVLVATLATPLGATLTKAALRIGGVLVGGIAGFLVAMLLLPFITSLPAICAVNAVFLFAFLLLQQTHERYTLSSLQAAIAFILTLVIGAGPTKTTSAPLDSLIGLAFGISVVVVVMHAVWPLDAADSAHRVLATLVRHIGGRFARALAAQRQGRDARAARLLQRERAAAGWARAYAAGFTHEVELYGAQFGRPHEHLRELLRLVVVLEAVVSLLEDSPAPRSADAAPGAAQLGEEIARACDVLAATMAALPGEASEIDGSALDLLAARAAAFLADAEQRAPALRAEAGAASLAAGLLEQIRHELESPGHVQRRRAA